MRKELLSILILSILVTSTLVGCGQGQSTPSLTVFSTSGGNVSVMKAGAANWIEAEVGMSLEPGDIIKSSDDSSAEITFQDGTTIEIEAGTEIEVASLDYSADTGSATVVVKQTIGSIIFRVTKIVDPASRYEVETPAGVVAVRGSAVQITVIEDGTTWACNLEGDIWAIAQGVELQIPEGRCCVIRPGQPPKLVCDLTISSTTGGSVTIPGEGTFPYDKGTVVDLVAEAEEGYQFGSWSGDVDTITCVNATTTTITMTDNHSIMANFERIPVAYYTLTMAIDGSGSTSPSAGQHSYAAGTVIPIVATPADGYDFLKWTGDVDTIADVNSASTTINMTGNCSITANFGRIYYTLTVAINGSGSTSPSVGQHSYAAGTVVAIMATPAGCYGFVNWTGNVGTIANVNAASTTITMSGDYSITANFEGLEVTFPDPNLEAAVRDAIGIPTGPIYASDLDGLTYLEAPVKNIADLTGLECATSLAHLYLEVNQISDISVLANLTGLRQLGLNGNQISDISPLANLTNLAGLGLNSNQISDISPLVANAGLSAGDAVDLRWNPLSSDSINVYIPQLEARGVTVYY